MSNQPDDAQLLRNAIRHHNAGLLGEAETIYRQILLRNPNQPDALHLIGIIAGQRGQPQTAAELIRNDNIPAVFRAADAFVTDTYYS